MTTPPLRLLPSQASTYTSTLYFPVAELPSRTLFIEIACGSSLWLVSICKIIQSPFVIYVVTKQKVLLKLLERKNIVQGHVSSGIPVSWCVVYCILSYSCKTPVLISNRFIATSYSVLLLIFEMETTVQLC